jgi:hypothetical protein
MIREFIKFLKRVYWGERKWLSLPCLIASFACYILLIFRGKLFNGLFGITGICIGIFVLFLITRRRNQSYLKSEAIVRKCPCCDFKIVLPVPMHSKIIVCVGCTAVLIFEDGKLAEAMDIDITEMESKCPGFKSHLVKYIASINEAKRYAKFAIQPNQLN